MKNKLSKILLFLTMFVLMFSFTACGNSEENKNSEQASISESNTNSQTTSESNSTATTTPPEYIDVDNTAKTPVKATVKTGKTKIFLAGDSTVKTYPDNQYIGGWGQFLQNYLDKDKVEVVNKSNGGRSSRSFINEGRLYTYSNIKYSSSLTSIESEIENGDYLFIQFGHNDDDTSGSFDNYIDRKVAIGTPDANGIYPTIVPTKKAYKDNLPDSYELNYASNPNMFVSARSLAASYGDYYYSYDCGTFKGFLKMYVDFARAKGAIPVLCTPVSRVSYSSDGKTIIAANGKHGKNLEYVVAVRQLAQEENCLLMDLYADTKSFLEATEKAQSDFLMAWKSNALTGEWPVDYDADYTNGRKTGIEGTHYNKYGAFITAAKVTEHLLSFSTENKKGIDGEQVNFASSILSTPTSFITPSSLMTGETVSKLKALFTTVKISA